VTSDDALVMTARISFTDTSSFHDSSSTTTPAYDFVARPKHALPPTNASFASIPLPDKPAPVLAPGFVPERPRGLTGPMRLAGAAVLALVLVALAVVGGTFGWRTYQDHRRAELIRSTHIVLPESIVGMTKRGGAVQAQVDKLVGEVSTPAPAQGAAYVATKSKVALVLAGTYAMTDQDQHEYMAAVTDTARSMGIALAPVDPGHLGGHMMCGSPAKGAQTLCAFTDLAAYGVLVVPAAGAQGASTAAAFRTAVERRS
jgi:hypothetical protein